MSELPSIPARWSAIGAAAIVGVAFVGFVAGTRDPQGTDRPRVVATAAAATTPATPETPTVPRYRDLALTRRGDNAQLYGAGLQAFALPPAGAPGERRVALTARSERRAYDGAPPTIPHPVEQQAAPACLACHEGGLAIGGKVARPMSHAPQQSCVQCHVPSADPRPPALGDDPPRAGASNGFVGLPSSGVGPRAWPGAPPQIPHAVFMRERCASCHGIAGHAGLRAQHDPRSSCLQCHVPVGDRLPQPFPRSAP